MLAIDPEWNLSLPPNIVSFLKSQSSMKNKYIQDIPWESAGEAVDVQYCMCAAGSHSDFSILPLMEFQLRKCNSC